MLLCNMENNIINLQKYAPSLELIATGVMMDLEDTPKKVPSPRVNCDQKSYSP